jgi:hypothetical protein
MADEQRETLRRLEERLDQASEQADRLIAEARAEQASGQPEAEQGDSKPPPAGWQAPGNDHRSPSPGAEFDALINAARSLRELVPPEVAQRLVEAVKEVLMAIRALLDWYIERLDRRTPSAPEVEDIPIQ